MVAGLLKNNKKILAALQHNFDSVAFTTFPYERYPNLLLKSLSNQEEYFCNLQDCNLFVCEGQTSFLADAFYNGKYSAIFTDVKDMECVLNSEVSSHLKLSSCVYDLGNLQQLIASPIVPTYSPDIRHLHDKLEEI